MAIVQRSEAEKKAENELRNYSADKVCISNLEERIEIEKMKRYGINSSIGSDAVKGGSDGNKLDNIMDSIARLEAELEQRKMRVAIVERSLEAISSEDRFFLTRFYFDGIGAEAVKERLTEELHLDERQIWRKKKRSLHNYIYASGII